MRFCNECLCVNAHHPNCPEADDYDDTEAILYEDDEPLFSSERERPNEDGDR